MVKISQGKLSAILCTQNTKSEEEQPRGGLISINEANLSKTDSILCRSPIITSSVSKAASSFWFSLALTIHIQDDPKRQIWNNQVIGRWYLLKPVIISAVQNERQPRNTATIRPETLRDMSAEQERALREAAVAVGVFG